jgi:hypothetical protein
VWNDIDSGWDETQIQNHPEAVRLESEIGKSLLFRL